MTGFLRHNAVPSLRVIARTCAGLAAIATCLVGSGAALAEPPSLPREGEITVDISQITQLLGNQAVGDLRGCPPNTVSNAANFQNYTQGSQMTLQLGMVETEGFGFSVSVPANQYPIEINTIRFLIGSISAATTTTGYSIIIWDGLPVSAGGQVRTFDPNADISESSTPDGSQFGGLEDVVLSPFNGTCSIFTTTASAADVTVGVDPSADPADRWILYNSRGDNAFTVVVRIDRHSSRSNPSCATAPECSNAFLATEPFTTQTLNFASNDWLLAAPCLGGAPDGYTRFSNLSLLYRPTADPLIGATWTSLGCGTALAACCNPNDGSCALTTEVGCINGGTWLQGVLSCDPTPCPLPSGACCFGTSCSNDVTESDCLILEGLYLGNNSNCAANNTCPTGACCLPSGACVVETSANCGALSGTFRGVSAPCSTANCPQPSGACCTTTGGCAFVAQSTCNQAGGTWRGAGVVCANAGCGSGSCCVGAHCSLLTSSSCSSMGGAFGGFGSSCVGWPSNPITCCPANFDDLNGVDVVDLFDYLDAWFTQNGFTGPGWPADFNSNNAVDVVDLFGFLDAWFLGCN